MKTKMTRIILELEGDPAEVEAALHYLVETGEVRLITYRTKDDVPSEQSLVANWCDSAKALNEWATGLQTKVAT